MHFVALLQFPILKLKVFTKSVNNNFTSWNQILLARWVTSVFEVCFHSEPLIDLNHISLLCCFWSHWPFHNISGVWNWIFIILLSFETKFFVSSRRIWGYRPTWMGTMSWMAGNEWSFVVMKAQEGHEWYNVWWFKKCWWHFAVVKL